MSRPLRRTSAAGPFAGRIRVVVLALAATLALCLLSLHVVPANAGAQGVALPVLSAGALNPPLLRIDLRDANPLAQSSADGRGVVLPSDGSAVTFALRFVLPPPQPGMPPWVLRFNHIELKRLQLSAPGWAPPAQDFFHPRQIDGRFPTSFNQVLPVAWSGPVEVRVTAATDLVRTLRPELLAYTQGLERDKLDLVVIAAMYASLAVLAAVGLTLLLGTREPTFLSYLGLVGACFLEVMVVNGHVYAWWPWAWLAGLGAQTLNASVFLICAAGTLVVRDYVGSVVKVDWYRRAALALALSMLFGALFCISGLVRVAALMPPLVTAAWVATEMLAAFGIVAASLRAAWLGLPLLAALLPLGVSSGLFELSVRGTVGEFWGSYGYLISLVLMTLLLVVGMLGHVSGFRMLHEEERQARETSEEELARQVALSGLGHELRQSLQLVGARDMHVVASQITLARLIPLLELKSASVVLYRNGESDARVIEPAHYEERVQLLMDANAAKLRSIVQWQTPAAQMELVGPSRVPVPGVVFAGVPFAIARGDLGVVLLEREDDKPFGMDDLAVAMDFSSLALQTIAEAKATLQLRRSAELDALTGTLNRSTIEEQLAASFAEAYQHQQALSVLFVDLDHFKSINDTHGHACGDYCLRKLTELLRSELRAGDFLGRYGGEEFLALLPGCDGVQAVELGERLRRAVEDARLYWQGREIRLTISIGVSPRALYEDKPEHAVARADGALYAAKRGGRNQVQLTS